MFEDSRAKHRTQTGIVAIGRMVLALDALRRATAAEVDEREPDAQRFYAKAGDYSEQALQAIRACREDGGRA